MCFNFFLLFYKSQKSKFVDKFVLQLEKSTDITGKPQVVLR